MGNKSLICPSCNEKNNPAFIKCWKCTAPLVKADDSSQRKESNLISIPRVESKAPSKNTVEWEIPGKILVGLMRIGTGYRAFVKVLAAKKNGSGQSWENHSACEADAGASIFKVMPFLERHGYTLDADTVRCGEIIGDPGGDGGVNEKEEGPVKEYFPNGQVKTEGVCRDGKLEGLVSEYYENRQIKTEEIYKNGELDGPFKSYYESGHSKTVSFFKNGKRDGLTKHYHENGQLEFEAVFRNGERVEETVKKYDENGKLISGRG